MLNLVNVDGEYRVADFANGTLANPAYGDTVAGVWEAMWRSLLGDVGPGESIPHLNNWKTPEIQAVVDEFIGLCGADHRYVEVILNYLDAQAPG